MRRKLSRRELAVLACELICVCEAISALSDRDVAWLRRLARSGDLVDARATIRRLLMAKRA